MGRQVKRLVWDIETSPNIGYFWRPGWRVSIGHDNIIRERAVICICYKWVGQKKVHSLVWNNGNDEKMIREFLKIAMEADELIAHNGDQFDLTWFQGRCLKHGLDPSPVFTTVDTLRISRKNFNFNSHKLEYLASHLTGEHKLKTDFSLWRDVCDGDKKALDNMVRYCKQDVRVLEHVWDLMKSFYRPKTHAGVLAGHDRWTCPHDGSFNVKMDKCRVTAAGVKRYQFKCKDCGRYYTVPNNVYLQFLEEED